MNIIKFLSDILLPRRCDYCSRVIGFLPLCEACDNLLPSLTRVFSNSVNNACARLDFVENAYAVYDYASVIRTAIIQMKFYKKPEKATIFGKIIAQKIKACNITETFDIIISVPSTKKALRKRGYDVPRLLAREIGNELQKPVLQNAIKKDFETKQQAKLTGAQRRGNLAGAFSVKLPEAVKDKRILLIDDVITTGTTLNECAKMLLYAGAKSVSSASIAASSDNLATNRK